MKKILSLIMLGLLTSLSSTAQISFMSYNIKYANENDGENSWSNRKEHLTNQLKFYSPDIFGVQEALLEQLQHFTRELPDYQFVGVGRGDGKEQGEFSAILYRASDFEVLETATFWLSETPAEVSMGWDASHKRICTYAQFKEKNTGKTFWVFNTHFDHRGDEARKQSAELITNKIKEINSDGLPVFLMGDFNLEPDSEPIQHILGEMKDSRATATDVVFGPEGTFTGYNFGKPVGARIDYIFHGEGVEVSKYGVLTDSKEMRYPSDHFPVYIQVKLETRD